MAHAYHLIIVASELLVRLVFQVTLGQIYPRANILLAADGQQALQLYKQFKINLIISIKVRGEQDDFKSTRVLRAGNTILSIIVISTAPMAKVEAIAAGATLFLSGSTLISDLKREVVQLLPP